jgi:hypothetical protein
VLTLQRAAELGLTSSAPQSPSHQPQQQQQQQQYGVSECNDADYETDPCELSSITMTPQSAYTNVTNNHNSNYHCNSGSRQSRRQLWQAGMVTRQLPRHTATSSYYESPYTPAPAAGASSRRQSSLRRLDVCCDGDSSSGADVSPRRAVRRLAASYTARSASSTRRNSVSSDAAAQQQQQQQQRQRPQRSSSVASSSAQRQRSQSVSTCVATPQSVASPVKQQQQQQYQQQRRWSSLSMVSSTANHQQQQQCEWVQGAGGYCTRQRVDRRSEFSEAAALAAAGAGKPLWNVSTRGAICAEPFARRASIGPVLASHERGMRCWGRDELN